MLAGRVDGELAVSRSLGDFLYKESGVICHPDVERRFIDKNCEGLVVCTDGIWDVMSS